MSGLRTATVLVSIISFVLPLRVHGNEHKSLAGLGAATGDGIVVVSNDSKITECLENALRDQIKKTNASLRVVPYGEIRNAFFPWLELKANNRSTWMTTITDADEITEKLFALKTNQVARPAFEKTRLQYVVRAESETSIDEEYVGDCISGYTGGFCLGVVLGDKESKILASIWDMRNPRKPMNREASDQGDYAMPVFLLPIPPIRPDTERVACLTLAEGIIDTIR
jgi:hypothetical protein